jgi:hypothetical protein
MRKKRRGRPLKEIDAQLVFQMSMVGCTTQMIAVHFGCDRKTLENRFSAQLEEGRAQGQVRILGRIFHCALNGNQRCLELAAINLCHWRTRPEISVVNTLIQGVTPAQSAQETKQALIEMRAAAGHNGDQAELPAQP